MRVILPFIILGAAAAVMVFLLLDPFGAPEEEQEALPDDPSPLLEEEIESAIAQEDTERLEVLPGGEAISIEGRLYLSGSPLSGITVQAFADVEEPLPPEMIGRFRTSPLFYSARGKEILAENDLLDVVPSDPHPAASCTSMKKGDFSLAVGARESVSFGLDHDYYFLPRDEDGPFDVSNEKALDRFDGKLNAELGAMLRGTVTDSDGFPLNNVKVMLLPMEEGFDFGRWGGGGGSEGRLTLTDDDGKYAMRGVVPDRKFHLSAEAEGLAPGETDPFETRAGEVRTFNIKLYEGAAVLVHVDGPEGKPLDGAEVFISKESVEEEPDRRGRGGRGMFTLGGGAIVGANDTDEEGEVLFEALAPGSYSVKACYPGYHQARTDQPVAVKEDGKAATIKLTLTYGRTVSGTVVDDLEQPVKGAKVQALPHSGRSGGGFRGGDFRSRMEAAAAPPSDLKETLSAADGSFMVTGLADAKSYDLFAEAKGLVPAEAREVEAGTADVRLVMVRPGQIRGRVVASLTGKPVTKFTISIVPAPEEEDRRDRRSGRGGMGRGDFGRDRGPRDATGKLFEAFGELMRGSPGPSLAPTEREDDFRDSGGNFELKEIVPSRYRLCVSASGFAPKLTDPIVVEKGEVVRDLVVSLGPGAMVSGKALSPTGPVDDARIRIQAEENRDEEMRLLLDTLEECESNHEGLFRIASLPAGKFVLRASHPDHPSYTSDAFDLTEGQLLPDVIVLFPPGAVITGVALDSAGAPLADSNVLCRGEGGGRGGFERKRTDEEGNFEFKDLRAGTYSISIFSGMRGFRSGRGGEDAGAMEVTVEAGETAEVVLQDTAPEGTTVQGIITDDSGPVGSGFVTVSPTEGGGRGSMRNGMIADDGTYKVEGVMPGTNRFTMRFSTGSSFESSTLEFDIPDLSEVLLDIALPGGRITGTVLDAATRIPLGDVRVSLTNEGEGRDDRDRRMRGRFGGGGRTVVTGKDGSFKFRLLAAGTYNIEARPSGELDSGDGFGYYTAEVLGLVLGENQMKDNVRVLLGPGGAIQVQVVDENNTPFEGALITASEEGLSPGGPESGPRGRSDEEGMAILNRVKPAVYSLNIQARQMGQQVLGGVYVAPGQTTIQQVTITTGFQVSVRLKDAGGEPIEGADLTLKNGQGLNMTVRGRGGRSGSNTYSLGNLPPGQYTVQAAWDGKTGTAGFNVQGEGTLSVTIR